MTRKYRNRMALGLLLASLTTHVVAALPADRPPAAPESAASDAPTAWPAEYAYGPDALQKLDFWHATGAKAAPLVLFVHGGGWKRGDKGNATGAAKVRHLLSQGYAFTSMNYRLVPAATVEQQSGDLAAVLAWLVAHAQQLGIDSSRIVLMGHSAGAQLAALVGTDPQYMTRAGLQLSALRGVVILDGACYDIPRQIANRGRFMRSTYLEAFGSDLARQRALSPVFQAAAPNAPAFLIVHIERPDSQEQSEALAQALRRAGTPADLYAAHGTGLAGHMEINSALGNEDYAATAVVDSWLHKAFNAHDGGRPSGRDTR